MRRELRQPAEGIEVRGDGSLSSAEVVVSSHPTVRTISPRRGRHVEHEGARTQDSREFLDALTNHDSSENKEFGSYLVGALQKRLERTLMDPDRPTIGFTDKLYVGDPSFGFSLDPETLRVQYELDKSAAFWQMLEERPNDFQIDCQHILQVSIIGTMRDVLIERGYEAQAVDDRLTGMTFQGQRTELTIDGKRMRPFAFWEDDPSIQSFSRRRDLRMGADHDESGFLPETLTANIDLEAGDIIGLHSVGTEHFADYGNGDNQNGVVLARAERGTTGDEISVFAHVTSVNERNSTLGAMFRLMSDGAIGRGMTMEEYREHGSVGISVIAFDYAGFYAALAEGLQKTHS